MTTVEKLLCGGCSYGVGLAFGGFLAFYVCPLVVSFVVQLNGAVLWSEACHWMCWFWGTSGAGQGQPLLVPCPGPLVLPIK